MEGTVPLSLNEALRVLRGSDATISRSSLSDSPVDILAVIVDITYERFGQGAPVDRREFARIWIADDSIDQAANDDQKSFMISLRNVKDRSSIQQHKIATGDVMRFNRVGIRKSNNSTANNNNNSITHFYHPFENPEAGLEWFRLGHVNTIDHGAQLLAMEERIPDSMKTDRQRLQQLLTWYRHQSTWYSPHIAPLDPLPCQRRTLLQLQSLVGTLSHVVARVTNIRQAAAASASASSPNAASSSSKRHYKRQKTTITSTSALAPCPGSSWCAELSDDGGRHSTMLLSDSCSTLSTTGTCTDTFRQVLVQAKETKRPVRVTFVRTQVDDNSEVFLVATNQSTGTFLTASEEVEFSKHEEESSALSAQQTQFPFSSCTQQQQQTPQQHYLNHTIRDGAESTIRMIKAFVRQIMIVEDKTDINTACANTLNEKSTTSECSHLISQFLCGSNSDNDLKEVVTFTLELVVVHNQQQTQDRQHDQYTTMPTPRPTNVLVSATPAIVERLCGGGSGGDGCSGIEQDAVDDQKRCNKHTEMLANVLQALLVDQVQLEWSLLMTEQCQLFSTVPSKRDLQHVVAVQDVILPGV